MDGGGRDGRGGGGRERGVRGGGGGVSWERKLGKDLDTRSTSERIRTPMGPSTATQTRTSTANLREDGLRPFVMLLVLLNGSVAHRSFYWLVQDQHAC